MSETFLGSANFFENGIRTVFSTLDRPAYWLLEIVYQLFFNVASADIFANGMVMKFYGRIQMILSVFMMFQLALIIIKGIMNPDSFYDKKSGVGNFVTRVVVALVLLTLMVPIKTGNNNEFSEQISSNGLLFGTLYSLQHRILANNTIGKLVMGTSSTDYISDSSDIDDLKKASRIFTSTVLRGFYRINLLPETERPKHEDGKDDAVFNANRVCQNIDDKLLDTYTKIDAEPADIIGLINETCEPDFNLINYIPVLSSTSGTKKYAFTFMPFISTIVGFMFAFILLSFTVDVAVRAVKLAVLRLIAPIPIIAYMNPKGSTDTAFNSWVKTLASTYLDLFIRLASVYFVIAIIQEMIAHGIYINHGSGILGIISIILIWFGLFIFAKQAPKFIKDVLGLKEGPGKLFGGFGELMGVGAAALGTVGSAVANYRAASEESRQLYPDHKVFGAVRNFGSTIAGAIGGGYVGAKALTGKDASVKSVLAAQSQRNAQRAAHSTLPGRIGGDIYGMFSGRSLATRDQGRLDANKAASSSLMQYKKTAVEEAMKKGEYGTVSQAKDRFHRLQGIQFNYRELEAAMGTKDTSGNFDYTDRQGNVHHLNAAWFDTGVMADIEDSQTASYLRSEWDKGVRAGKTGFDNDKLNTDWRNARHDMDEAGLRYAGDYLGDVRHHSDAYKDLGSTIGKANSNVSDMSTDMRHIMNRANSQGKK